MIKNIIFDLSEVIISGYHGTDKLIEKRYGIKADEFLKRKEKVNNIFLEAMRGKVTEEQYLKELINVQEWKISVQDMKDIIRENLNVPVQGTLEIIKKLKRKYKLILLSDHIKEWADYILKNNTDLDIFDEKFFSYELKRIKQDTDTFKVILEQLKINAKETIFIDDYQINIDMAKEQGIEGILFLNASQLENELKSKLRRRYWDYAKIVLKLINFSIHF